jgi:hypothetical protein
VVNVRGRNQKVRQREKRRTDLDLIESLDLGDLERTSSYSNVNTSIAPAKPMRWSKGGMEIMFSIPTGKQLNMLGGSEDGTVNKPEKTGRIVKSLFHMQWRMREWEGCETSK